MIKWAMCVPPIQSKCAPAVRGRGIWAAFRKRIAGDFTFQMPAALLNLTGALYRKGDAVMLWMPFDSFLRHLVLI